ncbi:hypothetical protein [Paludisphaera soli]|uniref:hypothetical protein n=1 Tax=Paludisphaera soli TaxID=2712865 RepID=UPI0013EBC149|nr:hypothetical protein [Paludisphaera soli]
MGFDCTLHVVDEKRIRDGFVPRLLGRSDERCPFDEREDADALWAQVRELLAGSGRDADSAGRAANTACQLAIAYCAAELPYHYERGFCLSLWPEAESPEAAPGELLDDPEGLFTELVAEHPALAGRFPLEIESNFSPGCFASADNVPAFLEWVEPRVQALPEGDRRPYRGLLLVLKEAASRGLAYWEGTDLPVPMMVTIRPPADLRRADLEEHPSPEGIHLACVGRAGPIVAFSHALGFPNDCRTAFADLTAWPPSFSIADEYALSAARSRGGRWVTASMTPDRPYLYRVRVADRPEGAKTLLLPPDERENGIKWADFLGESVVAVLDAKEVYPEKTMLPALLLIEQDGRLAPLEGFPPIAEKFPTFGVVHLDEGDVLIWGGDGYERRGAGSRRPSRSGRNGTSSSDGPRRLSGPTASSTCASASSSTPGEARTRSGTCLRSRT